MQIRIDRYITFRIEYIDSFTQLKKLPENIYRKHMCVIWVCLLLFGTTTVLDFGLIYSNIRLMFPSFLMFAVLQLTCILTITKLKILP